MRKLYNVQGIIDKISSKKIKDDDFDDFAYSMREMGLIDDDAYINYSISKTKGLPRERKAVKKAGFEIETDSRIELPSLKQTFFSHAARWPVVALGISYAPLLALQYPVTQALQSTPTQQMIGICLTVLAYTTAMSIKPKQNLLAQYSKYALDSITFGNFRRAHWAAHYDRTANKLEAYGLEYDAENLREKSKSIRDKFRPVDTVSLPFEDGIVPVPNPHVSATARKIENQEIFLTPV